MLICFPSKEPKQLTPLLTFLSPRPLTTSKSEPTRLLPTPESALGEEKVTSLAIAFFFVILWRVVGSQVNLPLSQDDVIPVFSLESSFLTGV